jgi:hypothetical protein
MSIALWIEAQLSILFYVIIMAYIYFYRGYIDDSDDTTVINNKSNTITSVKTIKKSYRNYNRHYDDNFVYDNNSSINYHNHIGNRDMRMSSMLQPPSMIRNNDNTFHQRPSPPIQQQQQQQKHNTYHNPPMPIIPQQQQPLLQQQQQQPSLQQQKQHFSTRPFFA